MLGIKPQQLSDWFNGHREPTADRVLQIQELIRTKPTKRKADSEIAAAATTHSVRPANLPNSNHNAIRTNAWVHTS
jgi:hypothetical protein